jgi:hypothetical protein
VKSVFALSDENIRQATGSWLQTNAVRIKITINTNKKQKNAGSPIAEVLFAPI